MSAGSAAPELSRRKSDPDGVEMIVRARRSSGASASQSRMPIPVTPQRRKRKNINPLLLKSGMKNWLQKHGRQVKIELKEEDRREIRECFELLDADGNGTLDADELYTAFQVMGMQTTRKQVVKLIDEFDDDGSGVVEYAEFEEIMGLKKNEEKALPEHPEEKKGPPQIPFQVMVRAFRRKTLIDGVCEGNEVRRQFIREDEERRLKERTDVKAAEAAQKFKMNRLKSKFRPGPVHKKTSARDLVTAIVEQAETPRGSTRGSKPGSPTKKGRGSMEEGVQGERSKAKLATLAGMEALWSGAARSSGTPRAGSSPRVATLRRSATTAAQGAEHPRAPALDRIFSIGMPEGHESQHIFVPEGSGVGMTPRAGALPGSPMRGVEGLGEGGIEGVDSLSSFTSRFPAILLARPGAEALAPETHGPILRAAMAAEGLDRGGGLSARGPRRKGGGAWAGGAYDVGTPRAARGLRPEDSAAGPDALASDRSHNRPQRVTVAKSDSLIRAEAGRRESAAVDAGAIARAAEGCAGGGGAGADEEGGSGDDAGAGAGQPHWKVSSLRPWEIRRKAGRYVALTEEGHARVPQRPNGPKDAMKDAGGRLSPGTKIPAPIRAGQVMQVVPYAKYAADEMAGGTNRAPQQAALRPPQSARPLAVAARPVPGAFPGGAGGAGGDDAAGGQGEGAVGDAAEGPPPATSYLARPLEAPALEDSYIRKTVERKFGLRGSSINARDAQSPRTGTGQGAQVLKVT